LLTACRSCSFVQPNLSVQSRPAASRSASRTPGASPFSKNELLLTRLNNTTLSVNLLRKPQESEVTRNATRRGSGHVRPRFPRH
jgi:hypothetical protein